MLILSRSTLSALLCRFVFWAALTGGISGVAQEVETTEEVANRKIDDVTILPPFKVKGVRLEEFGFRLSVNLTFGLMLPLEQHSAQVSEIFPNTAAAKAGLRPGDFIERIDGKSLSLSRAISLGTKPQKLQERKWAELQAGKKNATLALQVHAPGEKASRTVTLIIPSPPPHWGSEQWIAPEGRTPAVVKEAGPLEALARNVLDNGIWSMAEMSSINGARVPVLGYEWRIVQPSGSHRIWVTQQQGKTEITLEHRPASPELEFSSFSTSTSGAMDKGRCLAPKIKGKRRKFAADEIRAEFEAEIDFWLNKVGRVTGRWPFEALSGETEVITSATSSWNHPKRKSTKSEEGKINAPLADSFLKLPPATAEQKELFFAAFGKVGLDADGWAFTETSRSLEDNHLTTVRFDPSKTTDENCTLLKVDGKAPKAAYLQQWRSEGHAILTGLGELPALTSVVDTNDVRLYADETAAMVFELPVQAANAEFPADKFQARFRVNKTSRGLEDFAVKLREPMRVGGIAKVTEAGLEVRFQAFDPALAPQPVSLKMGGGVRVLFVRFSRAFEATRTDFKRVVPFQEESKPNP